MIRGMLGIKIGMTQVFREDGRVEPVTVIQAGPCVITQVKTKGSDGYEAAQVGYGQVKKLSKPLRGHLGRTGLFRHLREFPVDTPEGLEVGQQVKVDLFQKGEKVDVIGTSKGRGFQGVMKRHGFHGGPEPTASPTGPGPRVPSAPAQLQAGCSKARRWRGTWGTSESP